MDSEGYTLNNKFNNISSVVMMTKKNTANQIDKVQKPNKKQLQA